MMNWLEWSNPVALWWGALVAISLLNILFWLFTRKFLSVRKDLVTKAVLYLSSVYVFGCAFRSILPRADVQRICLFDTWFSNVFIGRSVATFAELSFVAQWAIVLNQVGKFSGSRVVEKISLLICPLILVAECFSWYGVITTHYLGNSFEESIWAFTYALITICLVLVFPKIIGALKMAVGLAVVGCVLYISFMVIVDVPMYLSRWQRDLQEGKVLLSLSDGLRDLTTRWIVTHDIGLWKTEIPWMSLYFSAAVWVSIALCYVPLSREEFLKHLKT